MSELLGAKLLGGANEIGASCALVFCRDDLGNEKVIAVDSGIRMKNIKGGMTTEGHEMPNCEVHAVLATHAHADHIGNLPVLIKANPRARVYMSRPTFYIAGAVWLDTLRLMDTEKIQASLDDICDFSEGARIIVKENFDNIILRPGWVNIFPGIDAYFGPNGHIRGSAFIVLKAGGKQVMFSGDISVYDSPTILGMKVPEQFIGNLDAIFVESTYGDRTLVNRLEEEERMAKLASETLSNGGRCLFPAFGIGRSPDVLLAQLIRNVSPLFLDGMGRKILDIYSGETGYWSGLDHSSGVDLINDRRIRFIRDRGHREGLIYDSRMPFSVVTTAGMMIPGSCAWQYATNGHFLENPHNLLGLTGYQAEQTEGHQIEQTIEGGKEVDLTGFKARVNARVVKLSLSSHADGMQIGDIVKKLGPQKVFINHGYPAGKDGLEATLRILGYQGEIHKPCNGDTIQF